MVRFGPDDKAVAVAAGLMGWALCRCGAGIPEGFGNGMVKVLDITGTASEEGLQKWADENGYGPR